jgi:UDP-N-acetylglucosamine 2-epimerase (non-hydrolysing)
MLRLERWLLGRQTDRLIVVGDVNATLAAALVGAKLGIPVDHVEAGLRSGDRGMPEEINRVATDTIASLLFASEPAAVANLRREGHSPDTILHVGNVMIDSLARFLPRARKRAAWLDEGLQPGAYGVVTLHRPSNVDDPARLAALYAALGRIAGELPLVFPAHPRTRRPGAPVPGLRVRDPLGYLEFLSLVSGSRLVITDSGGIQEETTFLGIPCLTLRDSTERPITVELGTNTLVGSNAARLVALAGNVASGRYKKGSVPPLWDGHAAERIADALDALA